MKTKDHTPQYRIDITTVEEKFGGGYEAVFPQLGRSLVGYGDTQMEAMQDLLDSVPLLIEAMEEDGDQLPEPEAPPEWKDYNGRVTLRLPKMLHYQLDKLANQEGVSMNSLLTTILQSGATALAAGCQFGVAAEPKLREVAEYKFVKSSQVPLLQILESQIPEFGNVPASSARFSERVANAHAKARTDRRRSNLRYA